MIVPVQEGEEKEDMYNEYLPFMIKLAKDAGEFILPHAGKAGQQTVKAAKDFVTDMDLRVEKFVIDRIQEQYPNHRIFSEEAGSISGTEDFEWVIDPIDGTINYSIGFPLYGVSIALTYQGEPVVAAISLPALGELFWAVKGEGAFLNGEQIRVRDVDLSESFLSFGDFAKDGDKKSNEERLVMLSKIVNEVYRVRIIGTAAVTLPYIAAGRWDAVIYRGPQYYDIAAGQLIIAEAGGLEADLGEYKIFSNSKVAPQLIKLLS